MAIVLVKETGAGLTNANAYETVAGATARLETHPDYATLWAPLTEDQQEAALINATTFLDTKWRWYGWTRTTGQSLKFPRTKIYDSNGVLLAKGSMPEALKTANALVAMEWVKEAGLFNLVEETGGVKSFSSAGISLSLGAASGKAETNLLLGKRMPEVELMLKNLGEFKDDAWFESRRTESRTMVEG